MRTEILSGAQDDRVAGARYYERQGADLVEYFLNSLFRHRFVTHLRRNSPHSISAIKLAGSAKLTAMILPEVARERDIKRSRIP